MNRRKVRRDDAAKTLPRWRCRTQADGAWPRAEGGLATRTRARNRRASDHHKRQEANSAFRHTDSDWPSDGREHAVLATDSVAIAEDRDRRTTTGGLTFYSTPSASGFH